MYELVRDADGPLTRDDVATATGSTRTAVGFHLDALVEAGLLSVDYARPSGRSGPGAGRPSKRYAATEVVVSAAVPQRRYELLGRILSEAVLNTDSDEVERRVLQTARSHGEQAGARVRPDGKPAGLPELIDVLRGLGYRPLKSPDRDAVRLRDCPFHAVSRKAPELVCPANLLYLQGVLDGLGAAEGIHAVL